MEQNIIIYIATDGKDSVSNSGVKDYLTTAAAGKIKNILSIHLSILFAIPNICLYFASTVLTALPVRSASQGESFAFIYFSKIIHLPGLSNSAGRFFYAFN